MRIVSLSTIPPRFPTLSATLNSLLEQRPAVDEIRLYVPRRYKRFPEYEGESPVVPDGVTLIRTDDDLGPASKVLFAARQLRGTDAQILFCDDDKVFSPRWAAELFTEQEKRTNECVALTGKVMPQRLGVSGSRHPKAVRARRNPLGLRLRRARHRIVSLFGSQTPGPRSKPIARAGYADILMGLGGVVVRPEFFDDEAFDIPSVVWTVDDVWLSGMLAKKDIPIWLPAGLDMPVTTEAHNIDSLYKATIEGARRRDANKQCVTYMQMKYGIWR